MKLDEHTCKRLSVLSFREKVVFVTFASEFYCPSTLLRSFRVRSIIITTPFLGIHHALVHILSPVHGHRNCFMTNIHKRKKYMTVEIVSLWWPISTKVCCRMWGSNTRPSACGHSRARVQPRYRARLERERERRRERDEERETKRESFLLCDSSRSLESLYASWVGNKEKESNISDLIDCFLNAIHRQSLSLSLSLSLSVRVCVCMCLWAL